MAERKAPSHLGTVGRRFWRHVVSDYDVLPWQYELLRVACEALDRCEEAREILEKAGGPVYDDRFGAPRKHPAVSIEENARVQFLRAARELALEPDDVPAGARPPRIGLVG